METVTLTFDPNSPFAARFNAFLETVPQGVKVSKRSKAEARKKRFIGSIAKAGRQALDIAAKSPEGYTADELLASIFDD